MIGLRKFSVGEVEAAIRSYGGLATLHEVNLFLGVDNSSDKERVARVLGGHFRRVSIDLIGRDFEALGGNIRWCYGLF